MDSLEVLGIILLMAGFILIGVEMLMPGFGVPGISGIICLIVGIIFRAKSVEEGLTITMIVMAALAVMLTVGILILKKVKPPFVLQDELKASKEFLNESDLEYLVGKEGVTSTDLKPSGKCTVGGIEFDVRAESKYVEQGQKVRISRIHENTIMVKKI